MSCSNARQRGKKLLEVMKAHKKLSCCVIVVIFLVLIVCASCIHNLIYFSDIAMVTGQDIEAFAAAHSDMECKEAGEEKLQYTSLEYEGDGFLRAMQDHFVYQFADINKENKLFDYYLKDDNGRYRIAAFQMADQKAAAKKFYYLTHAYTQTGKYNQPWLQFQKSKYAEFYYLDSVGLPFFQDWYYEDTIVVILSDSEEYGIAFKQELVDYLNN